MKFWTVNLNYPFNPLSKGIWISLTGIVLVALIQSIVSFYGTSCHSDFPSISAIHCTTKPNPIAQSRLDFICGTKSNDSKKLVKETKNNSVFPEIIEKPIHIEELPEPSLLSEEDDLISLFKEEIEDDEDISNVIVVEEPDINGWDITEVEPSPINLDQIKKEIGYPQHARDATIAGQVVLRVLVDKQGQYVKHKVIKSPHPILSDCVEKHIHKLRFTSAMQGDRPIKFWVNIPFNFHVLN